MNSSHEGPPSSEVLDAFELLTDEVEGVIGAVKAQLKEAVDRDEFDAVDGLAFEAREIQAFLQNVTDLRRDWAKLATTRKRADAGAGDATTRSNYGRVRRGEKTPQPEFRRPLLQALVDLGGSAPISEALDRVEVIMAGMFRARDFEPLPSDSTQTRWRNTAQWCRYDLVVQGLLSPGSKRGVWEITSQGRDALLSDGL